MESETPIAKLEAAVSAYVAELAEMDHDDDGSMLSGWVLAWQMTRVNDDPQYVPIQDAVDFVLSPHATVVQAVGLLALTKKMLMDEMLGSGDDD